MSDFGLSLASGFGVGYFYFLGLHWTVNRYRSFKHPILVFVLSFLTRTALAFGVFYFVGKGNFVNYILLLFGFILSRFFFLRKRGTA